MLLLTTQLHENEVMRAYKTVNDTYIEPISFTVPRRAEVFQSDIYPPATGLKPAVSAKDWLAGKDGVPSKIDLESIYDGSAPVEVASDYKPPAPVSVPSPTKAPEPKVETEPVRAPVSAPAPALRSPPPTISEQKGSIAALASKFQDDEPADDDDDDASSFEEVSRPVQRTTAPPSKVETKLPSPIKSTPASTSPTKPAQDNSAETGPRSLGAPATVEKSIIPASLSSGSSVETSLLQIKQLLEAQTKTITEQSQKIGFLAQEVDTLKRKVGNGGGNGGGEDQSERIRQLELELEAARS